jgi:hypothetical protein
MPPVLKLMLGNFPSSFSQEARTAITNNSIMDLIKSFMMFILLCFKKLIILFSKEHNNIQEEEN